MATRKKHTVLTMQQRLDVLKEIQETQQSPIKIAKKYGVDAKTIRRIVKNTTKINVFAEKSKGEKKRRRLVEPVYDELGQKLLTWFIERRTLGDHVTDASILKKAREIKDSLPSCANFKVSYGWLTKFKARHNIRLVHLHGEESSADEDAAKEFVDSFMKMIQTKNIKLENVYNMNESGLVWKALPTKTLAQENEESVSGYKVRKDRITVGLCANALGTHKLKPLVIYKYKNPKALKHCQDILPVTFKSQKSALMDRSAFIDWLENDFKPSVLEYQQQKEIYGKVILLLDKREGHTVSSEVQNDGILQIVYLPRDTTSILQPMNQGVIAEAKRSFRHKMLKRVLTYDGGVEEFYKNYTIKDCIEIFHASWQEITPNNIRNSWNKIISQTAMPPHVKSNTDDLQQIVSVITGEETSQKHVTDFLYACEQAESKENQICIEEGIIPKEEPQDEPEEIMYQGHRDEVAKTELRHIFERLIFYSTRAPTCIQCMVQGLKIFFLGKEY